MKQRNNDYKLNFSKTSQGRFDKFCSCENWSWVGLALALIKRFGLQEVESFHFLLGETLEGLKNRGVK